MAVIIGLGGVIGPVLMLVGLRHVSGTTGALTLNLEAPFTAVVAVWFFGEHLGRRGWIAGSLIVAGATLLAGAPDSLGRNPVGVGLIALACVCWAIDNNVTQQLTLRDPVSIVRAKATIAALVNLLIAFARHSPGPTIGVVGAALVLGALSYGVSILADAYALRLIGAAREAALFATAPFAGVAVAVAIGEPFTAIAGIAMVLMAVGAFAMVTERHSHIHTHDEIVHEHRHVHDAHHLHEHPPGVDPVAPHTHVHRHEPLVHRHEHVADAHHRHPHRHRRRHGLGPAR